MLCTRELARLARLQAMNSPVLYVIETAALGAVAVIGAQGGITAGVPPVVCVATGVTICFGGILRDLLCQKQLAIGAQSYALATAAGASVYVGLRELVLRGHRLPLTLRILVGVGTTVAQRAYVWTSDAHHGDHVLSPMANYRP